MKKGLFLQPSLTYLISTFSIYIYDCTCDSVSGDVDSKPIHLLINSIKRITNSLFLIFCPIVCFSRREGAPWAWWSISSDATHHHHIFTGREWERFAHIFFTSSLIYLTPQFQTLCPFFSITWREWVAFALVFYPTLSWSHLEPKISISLKWSDIFWQLKSDL